MTPWIIVIYGSSTNYMTPEIILKGPSTKPNSCSYIINGLRKIPTLRFIDRAIIKKRLRIWRIFSTDISDNLFNAETKEQILGILKQKFKDEDIRNIFICL